MSGNLDLPPKERERLKSIGYVAYYRGFKTGQSSVQNPQSCNTCKGNIAMTDVQGHYSGSCHHCRRLGLGDE